MLNWFRKKQPVETRAAGSGFTAEVMAARESYISGTRGLADLTATVQSCVSLWENGLTVADVTGTDLLTPPVLALAGRSLALRGEAVFVIRDRLVPCSDWDLRTRDGRPTAYRVSVSEAGGGRTETALAAEVLHLRIGCDAAAPWIGSAPLTRSRLTAGLLQALETALGEVYDLAPLGSLVVPFPESPETDMTAAARQFRGSRGRVLLRESVTVTAAGGPAPMQDWSPNSLTPAMRESMALETLEASRAAICTAFGVLPGLNAPMTTGPMVRESTRHLAQWSLQPVAELIAAEVSEKLASPVTMDVMRPLQAFDAGGRSRAMATVITALAEAKAAGIDPQTALHLVDWKD